MAKVNVFGQPLWLKKKVLQGLRHYCRRRVLNAHELEVIGAEQLRDLPESGVLFIANHQTVCTDVIAMYYTMIDTLNDSARRLKNPKLNLYYVAARESMQKGLLLRIFTMAGAVLVDRTWRKGADSVERPIQAKDLEAIGMAVNDGWVMTFPQGTTRPGAPVRKGTAHLIKEHGPIVVPVRVEGFNKAFDKSGLKTIDPDVALSIEFGTPLLIDADASVESLTALVANAIGEPHETEERGIEGIDLTLDPPTQILAS